MPAAKIEDISPFLAEKCTLFILLARAARIGVILRRGPTKWWRVSLWNTKTDQIEGGQWFHGGLYPQDCDLSPNGQLLLYFAGKFNLRDCSATYSAVSQPPYLTALTLWPNGDRYSGGGGVFLDDQTIVLHQGIEHLPELSPSRL